MRYEAMRAEKSQYDLALLDEEIDRLIETIAGVPYSALPLERPEIICFARRIEELTGYDADQILADRQLWINIIHPDDRERVFAVFNRCKNWGIPFEIEYRITCRNGSVHRVIDEGEPVFDNRGRVTQIEGIITDISEYTKAKICACQRNPEVTKSNNLNPIVSLKI
jgi:PAS domain S-box-containing protein